MVTFYGHRRRRFGNKRRGRFGKRRVMRRKRAFRKRMYGAEKKKLLETALAITVSSSGTYAMFDTILQGNNNNFNRLGPRVWYSGAYVNLEFYFNSAGVKSQYFRIMFCRSKVIGAVPDATNNPLPDYNSCISDNGRQRTKVLYDKTFIISRSDIDQRMVWQHAFKMRSLMTYDATNLPNEGRYFMYIVGDTAGSNTPSVSATGGSVCLYFTDAN